MPSVYRCPQERCHNHYALFPIVNREFFDYAREQFLKGYGKGPDRQMARKILKGQIKKTKKGMPIPTFGIKQKKYYNDDDVDRIFAVWDQLVGPTPKPEKGPTNIVKVTPSPLAKVERGPTDLAVRQPPGETVPVERPVPLEEIPEEEAYPADVCPHCRIKLENLREHIPRVKDPAGWGDIYERVGTGPFDWGVCDSCKHPFIIFDRNRLRRPTLSERLRIEKLIARYNTMKKLRNLREATNRPRRSSNELKQIEEEAKKVRDEYGHKWGGITINPRTGEPVWDDTQVGFREEALAKRRQLLRDRGLSNDEIDEMERGSYNFGEFDRRSYVRLGRFRPLGRQRRDYNQALDEEENLLADKHKLSDEEKEKYRRKRQERSSFDLGFFNKIGQKVGHTNERVAGSIITIIAGLMIASFMRDMWFFYGFVCFGFYGLLPTPGEVSYNDDILGKFAEATKKEAEHEAEYTVSERPPPVSARLGPLLPALMFARASVLNRDNTYNSGIAFTKVILKVAGIFFIGIALYASPLPMAPIAYLLFAFGAYYSLPISYDVENPEEFFGSTIRFLLGFFVPYSIWALFDIGLLFWISMAFLFVFPVAKAKSEAKALNMAVTAGESHREMMDKFIIFLPIMLLVVLVYMGLFKTGGIAGIEGTPNTVFWVVWGLGMFSGALSPSEVRPWTGVFVITVTFFLLMSGPGQQDMFSVIFGQWWPTLHNTLSTITEPFGELFDTLQNTFGQTFLLLTNPMGFAQRIMEGSYEPNPRGPTGAFGVEIENLQVPAIYPGTTAMLTMNVHNVGPEKGKNVRVKVEVPDDLKDVITVEPDGGTFNVPEIESGFIIPLFFTLDTDCDKLKSGGLRPTDRNKYIRVNVSVEYDYEVSSWMPLTIISDQEWRERSAKGTFTLSKVPSHISTSPVKLSIGSFEQPLIAGNNRRFYLGFNLTSAEGTKSAILWENVKVTMNYTGLGETNCKPPAKDSAGKPPFEWEGKDIKNRAVFCTFGSTPDPGAPSKTYYIRANASFRFQKWETKDTLFAFSDVCGTEAPTTPDFAFANCCHNIRTGVTKDGEYKEGTGEKCDEGGGGCRGDYDCADGIECRYVNGVQGEICCDNSTTDTVCWRKHQDFRRTTTYGDYCE